MVLELCAGGGGVGGGGVSVLERDLLCVPVEQGEVMCRLVAYVVVTQQLRCLAGVGIRSSRTVMHC